VAIVLISDSPGEFGNVSQNNTPNNTSKYIVALIIDEEMSFGEMTGWPILAASKVVMLSCVVEIIKCDAHHRWHECVLV
jgi:hypothetical protein